MKPSHFLGNQPGRDGEKSAASAPPVTSPWPRNPEAASHSTPEPKGGLLFKKAHRNTYNYLALILFIKLYSFLTDNEWYLTHKMNPYLYNILYINI